MAVPLTRVEVKVLLAHGLYDVTATC